MRRRLVVAVGAALAGSVFGARPAWAHRLDEYLQATTIAVSTDRIRAQLRLTPGIAVLPTILALVDADANGALTDAELRAYATRVLGDLSLAVDGVRLPLRLVAATAADAALIREGLGAITIDVEADVPAGATDRRLSFENRHQRAISVYLVNALAPTDPDIRVTAQHRSYEQTSYRLDYVQAGARGGLLAAAGGATPWLLTAMLLPLGWLALYRQRHDDMANDTHA